MQNINTQTSDRKFTDEIPPDDFHDFMMAAVRCARTRVQLLQLELDEVGIALKLRVLTPDAAAECLHDLGALRFVNPAVFGETSGQPE